MRERYEKIQEQELKSWLDGDPDKKQRETIRYPLLAKQMGLNYLDVTDMLVADVGAGPYGGVSSVLNARDIIRIDPLAEGYGAIANTAEYLPVEAEEYDYQHIDLVLATNAIDHFRDPDKFMVRLADTMKAGAYFAHLHAINNAITHPHPAHVHNINQEFMRFYLKDYECVWHLDYMRDGLTYGWRKQPAFAGLYRKVTGYK
jgi:2-polyprenyl-3-methyl-5-hydroxy-6-metoxy-1,4-benzoquinol methylase